MKFEPGKHYSFIYDGGSNPGTKRRVEVTEVHPYRITCVDMNIGEPRTFQRQYMRDAREIREEKIDFVNARQRIQSLVLDMSGEELAEALSAVEDKEYVFDSTTGMLVCEVEEKYEPTVNFFENETLMFTNGSQSELHVSFSKSNQVEIDGIEYTLAEGLSFIADFLNEEE